MIHFETSFRQIVQLISFNAVAAAVVAAAVAVVAASAAVVTAVAE